MKVFAKIRSGDKVRVLRLPFHKRMATVVEVHEVKYARRSQYISRISIHYDKPIRVYPHEIVGVL